MPRKKAHLCIDSYDCIGFDLDHTLCRYNIGPMVRLEYKLLTEFLVTKKGYDPLIRERSFDDDRGMVCKGLTLDCERGNLLRLGYDGAILTAMHGTHRLNDIEIEKIYGRCRKKHAGSEYTQHLNEFGPQKMVDFNPILHSFMDYFDIAAPLVCMRIVDVLDEINNCGKPMEEYFFWPDVQEGLRDMFVRTQFAADGGGYFPELKANPDKYIMKRRPEFRQWLQQLRDGGKYLYVITGSNYDFACHVASHAIGEDWKELFDIVIFFARKPSFFIENRPFWRLDGANEVESFAGWEDLETGDYYSQGNWKDMNEFFEYCTEWEPCSSLYFGDNVLQDVLAPKKFTTTIDSVAVSEEMFAEGMVDDPIPTHPHAEDIVSAGWGSYFYYPLPARQKVASARAASSFLQKAPSFDSAVGSGSSTQLPPRAPSAQSEDVKRAITLRRVSSMRTAGDIMEVATVAAAGFAGAAADGREANNANTATVLQRQRRSGSHFATGTNFSSETPSRGSTPSIGSVSVNSSTNTHQHHVHGGITSVGLPGYGMASVPASNTAAINPQADDAQMKGPSRINTLWGTYVRDYAKMCIPDVDVLVDYPIDYEFPAFGRDKHGNSVGSGFFPSDPISLHIDSPNQLGMAGNSINQLSSIHPSANSSHQTTNVALSVNASTESSNSIEDRSPSSTDKS